MGPKIFGIWDVVCFISYFNLVVVKREYVYNEDNDLCSVVFCDYGYTDFMEVG